MKTINLLAIASFLAASTIVPVPVKATDLVIMVTPRLIDTPKNAKSESRLVGFGTFVSSQRKSGSRRIGNKRKTLKPVDLRRGRRIISIRARVRTGRY